jgi:hypothetical protein
MCDPVSVGITSTVVQGGLGIGGQMSSYQQAKSNVAFANAQADMDYFQTQLDVDAANRQAQRQYFQAKQEEAYANAQADRQYFQAQQDTAYANARADQDYFQAQQNTSYVNSQIKQQYFQNQQNTKFANAQAEQQYFQEKEETDYANFAAQQGYQYQQMQTATAQSYEDLRFDQQQALIQQTRLIADSAYANEVGSLNLRLMQEQEVAAQQKQQANIQAMEASGSVRAAGRVGNSIESLIANYERQQAQFDFATDRNLAFATAQVQAEKLGAAATRGSRIASQQAYIRQPILDPMKPIAALNPMKPILAIAPLPPILALDPLKPIQGMAPIKPLRAMTPMAPIPMAAPIKGQKQADPSATPYILEGAGELVKTAASVYKQSR